MVSDLHCYRVALRTLGKLALIPSFLISPSLASLDWVVVSDIVYVQLFNAFLGLTPLTSQT